MTVLNSEQLVLCGAASLVAAPPLCVSKDKLTHVVLIIQLRITFYTAFL